MEINIKISGEIFHSITQENVGVKDPSHYVRARSRMTLQQPVRRAKCTVKLEIVNTVVGRVNVKAPL